MERLSRGETADELREQAASYRRIAKRARTTRGSSALIDRLETNFHELVAAHSQAMTKAQ